MDKTRGTRLLKHEANTGIQDADSTLTEIMHLIDMSAGVQSDGWHPESARLFAIDTAVMVVRRYSNRLTEAERQAVIAQLHEARRLVVAGRDKELGSIQSTLECHLATTEAGTVRQIWLVCIDALLPSPFRAALVVARSALLSQTAGWTDITKLLRERLVARLDEGSLMAEPVSTLFLIA
ncbi:MAG: hypothetical protein PVG83_03810 [Acidimicrobiia bacterium]